MDIQQNIIDSYRKRLVGNRVEVHNGQKQSFKRKKKFVFQPLAGSNFFIYRAQFFRHAFRSLLLYCFHNLIHTFFCAASFFFEEFLYFPASMLESAVLYGGNRLCDN